MSNNSVITYSGVRNPQWGDKAQTYISCEVIWDHVLDEEWSPCVVVGSGDVDYIHEIFHKIVNGDYGTIADYVRPENIPATYGDKEPAKDRFIREERDEKLKECDYVMLADNWSSLTSEKQAEWTAYRQALRELPNLPNLANLGGVFDDDLHEYRPSVAIPWPTKPS